MSEKPRLSGKMTQVLLALREGVRSWPLKVRRELSDIPRQTVEYQIKKLEEEGIIRGYTPIVIPGAFGEPYLLKLSIDPKGYQFQKDAELKIDAISRFFKEAIDQAPVSFFVLSDENRKLQVHAVTVTRNHEKLAERLSAELNIAREDISIAPLQRVEGIPDYSKHSILQEGQNTIRR